ncbi:DUF2218 domain-containing protein [Methylopila sp. Yamaguchi]|uniref:DUF2218 domain-containing protein n=1 Tax=Methylopila sp. Yamaguchi TaxID=1437817 RepID=UPI000CA89770|nr:DUF2218 domain-containing protein [Methylopila sp. Yamaguchi]GBD47833.1 hypothetical protein METY_1046 [Methylopila sp. Yamaguchi]
MSALEAARVPTVNGARYLEQLCKHWGHRLAIVRDGGEARVTLLNDAVVTLAATPEALDVAIRAATPGAMGEAKDTVVRHLDRFAFREAPLLFEWRDHGAEARSI